MNSYSTKNSVWHCKSIKHLYWSFTSSPLPQINKLRYLRPGSKFMIEFVKNSFFVLNWYFWADGSEPSVFVSLCIQCDRFRVRRRRWRNQQSCCRNSTKCIGQCNFRRFKDWFRTNISCLNPLSTYEPDFQRDFSTFQSTSSQAISQWEAHCSCSICSLELICACYVCIHGVLGCTL